MLQQSSRLDEDARCRECQYDEHKHVQSSTAPHTNRGMRDWCALHFGDVTPRRVALRMDAANHDEHDPLNGYKHGAFKNYPAQSRSLLTQGPTCWTSELPMCQREAGFQPWELAAQVEMNGEIAFCRSVIDDVSGCYGCIRCYGSSDPIFPG